MQAAWSSPTQDLKTASIPREDISLGGSWKWHNVLIYIFYCSFISKLNPESLDFLLQIRHVFIFLSSAVANPPPHPLPEGRLARSSLTTVLPQVTPAAFPPWTWTLISLRGEQSWAPEYDPGDLKMPPFLGCSSAVHLVFTAFSQRGGADGAHGAHDHSLWFPTNWISPCCFVPSAVWKKKYLVFH